MANQALFTRTKNVTVNNAGGEAFSLSDKEALANLVCAGMMGGTFYVSASDQLDAIKSRLAKVDPSFLAKLASYAREKGFMKDSPALILAYLAHAHPKQFKLAAPHVLTHGKMVRNFVQICRSGQWGRTTIPRPARKLLCDWITSRTPRQLLNDSVGGEPSLADIIKMLHPKPKDASQEALFAFLLGKPYDYAKLPSEAKELIDFRNGKSKNLPNLDFRLLDSCPLTTEHWMQIALQMGFTAIRMNLNTFERKGVFANEAMVAQIAAKIRNPEFVKSSKVFPFEILNTFKHISDTVPHQIREALQDAMEISIQNIPEVDGQWAVCLDVSGTMSSPVSGVRVNAKTGKRESFTSKTQYVDIASLMAAGFLRKNPGTIILPFDTRLHTSKKLNPRDSVMTLSDQLARFGGGGTQCELPMAHLASAQTGKTRLDGILFLSDNESHRAIAGRMMND